MTAALQTRAIVASHRIGRDLIVSGIGVPYGTVVSDGAYGKELFTPDTHWEIVGKSGHITLKTNHTTPVGFARIEEAPSGLHIRGRVHGAVRHFTDGKRAFSVGFAPIESHEHADGVRHHLKCVLFEVSLVGRAAHEPWTIVAARDANELDADEAVPQQVKEARSAMQTRALY